MAFGIGEFVSVVIPALAVALCMYLLFCCLRPTYPEVYEPRTLKVQKLEQVSQRLPQGFLSWLVPLLQLPLSQLAGTCGMDVIGYVAFQLTLLRILGLLTVLCLAVLFPVYATAEKGLAVGAGLMSLSNVSSGSLRLWASSIMCWPIAAVVYALVYRTLKEVSCLRISEERRACPLQNYTVMLRGVPDPVLSEAVTARLEEMFPGGCILDVRLVRDLGKGYKKDFEQYKAHWRSLKHAESVYNQDPDAEPPKTKTMPIVGAKVEAIPYFAEQILVLRQSLEEQRKAYGISRPLRRAFVTFDSLAAAAKARRDPRLRAWLPAPAGPEPRDLLWPNVRGNSRGSARASCLCGAASRVVVFLLLFFIIVLWAIPIAATQALANLEDLAAKFTWLQWVLELPKSVVSILQGLLPAVALAVLNALVVPIFTELAMSGGTENRNGIQRSLMKSYYAFLMVNSFIVVLVSGSLLNQLVAIMQDPSKVLPLLGESLPKVGNFFLSFITLLALGAAPITLSLLAKLIPSLLQLRFSCKTDLERDEVLDPGVPPYGVMYATDLFVWSVVVAYSVISPILLPFGWLYFELSHITGKYLLSFVFRSEYQGGGAQLNTAFLLALFGLLIGQLTVICVLAIKQSVAVFAVVPLPFITLAFMLWLAFASGAPGYDVARQDLPEKLAAELDEEPEASRRRLAAWRQEVMTEHVLEDPSYFADLDNPLAEKFMWEDATGSEEHASASGL